ncbi:MAG: hydrogenase maturation protease [Candidatus Bipolaricaulota bacterium]
MRALLVGFGHPLRRDDGVGLWVASRLEGTEGIEVVSGQVLTPELIPKVAEADLVLFVDARAGTGPVRWERLQPSSPPGLAHSLSPSALLAWGQRLFGRIPEAWLVTVPAKDFDIGEGLSPGTFRAASGLVDRIRTYIAERGKG